MQRIFSSRAPALLASFALAVAGSVLSLLPAAAPAAAAVPLATDRIVSTHQSTPSTRIVSPAFTTSQPNELLIAFVMSDGPQSSAAAFSSVVGGGLSWRLRERTNARPGTTEIWQAVAPTVLTNATVTATNTGSYQSSMTVVTFVGADVATDGAVGTGNAATGAPNATLTTTRTGSWVWGAGNDWDKATARTVGVGQAKVDEYLSSHGDTFWVQRQSATTTAAPPAVVPISDTAPTTDRWNLSLIEILPASTATGTPLRR